MKKWILVLPVVLLLSACWWNKTPETSTTTKKTEAPLEAKGPALQEMQGSTTQKIEGYLANAENTKETLIDTINQANAEKVEKKGVPKTQKKSSFLFNIAEAQTTTPATKEDLLSNIESNLELAIKTINEEQDPITLANLLEETQSTQENLVSDLRDLHDAGANQTAGLLEENEKAMEIARNQVADAIKNGQSSISLNIPLFLVTQNGQIFYNREQVIQRRAERIDNWLAAQNLTAQKQTLVDAAQKNLSERKMERQDIAMKVQSGDLTPEDGEQQLFELRKTQRQALADNLYTSLKDKNPTQAETLKQKFADLQTKLDNKFKIDLEVFKKRQDEHIAFKKIWDDMKTEKNDIQTKIDKGSMTQEEGNQSLQKLKENSIQKAQEIQAQLTKDIQNLIQ